MLCLAESQHFKGAVYRDLSEEMKYNIHNYVFISLLVSLPENESLRFLWFQTKPSISTQGVSSPSRRPSCFYSGPEQTNQTLQIKNSYLRTFNAAGWRKCISVYLLQQEINFAQRRTLIVRDMQCLLEGTHEICGEQHSHMTFWFYFVEYKNQLIGGETFLLEDQWITQEEGEQQCAHEQWLLWVLRLPL